MEEQEVFCRAIHSLKAGRMVKRGILSDADQRCMRRALALADGAKGCTFPNPAVGAVIALQGKIVGQGATARAGGPHAEIAALAQAGIRAHGATLYVTLEPCCHFGRTPPCTDAIVAAGIARVVAAGRDPNPLVAGKGLARLRKAGVAVCAGLLEEEARRSNEDYFYAIVNKQAWMTLKLAVTWDGRIADAHGVSRWITAPAVRAFVHDLRRRHAGVAVGMGTVRADDPLLTVRHVCGPSPARFVFASSGRIPPRCALARTAGKSRTVLVINDGSRPVIDRCANGLEIWRTGAGDAKTGMRRFLRMAYAEGLTSVLFEGGGRLASFCMEQRLVNRLYLCYGNKILGGGVEALAYRRPLALGRAATLDQIEFLRIAENMVVTGIPLWR